MKLGVLFLLFLSACFANPLKVRVNENLDSFHQALREYATKYPLTDCEMEFCFKEKSTDVYPYWRDLYKMIAADDYHAFKEAPGIFYSNQVMFVSLYEEITRKEGGIWDLKQFSDLLSVHRQLLIEMKNSFIVQNWHLLDLYLNLKDDPKNELEEDFISGYRASTKLNRSPLYSESTSKMAKLVLTFHFGKSRAYLPLFEKAFPSKKPLFEKMKNPEYLQGWTGQYLFLSVLKDFRSLDSKKPFLSRILHLK